MRIGIFVTALVGLGAAYLGPAAVSAAEKQPRAQAAQPQAQPVDQGQAPSTQAQNPCAPSETQARANGHSAQPTAAINQADMGCGPDALTPEQAQREAKEVDEMYERLMRDSAADLKAYGKPVQ